MIDGYRILFTYVAVVLQSECSNHRSSLGRTSGGTREMEFIVTA